MKNKKRIEQQIRGWLPKEPTGIRVHRTKYESLSLSKWGAVLVAMGTFAGALLGALGYFLGLTEGIGLYVWSMIVGVTIGTIIAVVLNRIKRKKERQRS